MLISGLQNHPITLVLFLTSCSLPFSYSQQQERILRPDLIDIAPPPPPPDDINPGGPDPIVGDPVFIEDLEKIFKRVPTCHTYKMSHLDENYETDQIQNTLLNWGMHALQWKGYNHIADNPGGSGTFDADLANASDPPRDDLYAAGFHVRCDGADRLDELELASSGIFKTDGNPTDPTGSWNCLYEYNPYSAAILGAMNMFYWNTPTYVDIFDDPLIGAVVMKEVTLCADGPEPPHVACNWIDNSGAEVGSCEATLVLESIVCGFFHNFNTVPGPPYYYEDDTYYSPNNIQRWVDFYSGLDGPEVPGSDPYFQNQLVFDPPAGTDVAALQESVRLTAANLLDPSELASMIESAKSDAKITTKGGMRGAAAPGGKK